MRYDLTCEEYREREKTFGIYKDIVEYIGYWLKKEDIGLHEFADRLSLSFHETTRMLSGDVDYLLSNLGKIYVALGHDFLSTPISKEGKTLLYK